MPTNMPISPYPNTAYEVGWISALPIELAAARGMLDQEHGIPQSTPSVLDKNVYVVGRLHSHNVVIACLAEGKVDATSAALCARNLLESFPNIRIGLRVGIGSGIPCWNGSKAGDRDGIDEESDEGQDVRLGDVVIGNDKKTGGIVAYNFGKKLANGSFETAYHLDKPPRVLRVALSSLEAAHELRGNYLPHYMDQMRSKLSSKMSGQWEHPGQDKDVLFHEDYPHQGGKTCIACNRRRTIRRRPHVRPNTVPKIHYGVIATGSQIVEHAATRVQIRDKYNAICLETEAAGLMNIFPCVVIRGIADYADAHKNDQWCRYAAASAAACAKELLLFVYPNEVHKNAGR